MTPRTPEPERAELEIGGRRVSVSRLDKVLWPETGFTKGDLIAWYRAAAPAILPHLAGRAVTLARFPEGVDGPGWYQTNCPPGAPPWIPVVPVAGRRGRIHRMCLLDSEAALAWAAQMGAIELHPFLAPAADPDRPLSLVFDLDPGPPAGLVACGRVALAVREALEREGLRGFAKPSGAKGLHVVVPLDGAATFADSRAFARAVAEELAARLPDQVVARMAKAERGGKVFIDWGQNHRLKSTVAPWSLRAMRRPLVSAPLGWVEVERAAASGDEGPLRIGPEEARARLAAGGDAWGEAFRRPQRVPDAGR